MLGIYKVIILFYIQNTFLVQCSIPSLSVRKFNQQQIQRKRQDTLDMCLKFNAENERLNQIKNHIPIVKSRRVKRSLDPIKFSNPVLNNEDVKRVESIVDRLYDDLEEKGEHVEYRQKKLKPDPTASTFNLTSNRRFDFAPSLLLPPTRQHEPRKDRNPDDGRVPVPWHKKWKHGIIPFFIDPKTYDSHLAEIIIKAFDYFERATCIRLQRLRDKPVDKQSLQKVEWVYITNPTGIRQCVHSNARKKNKGVQMIVLGYDCMSVGEISHEVMHILGFSHEHTRSDRDQYVTMLWDNIKPGYKKYFEVQKEGQLLSLPYDYASVLHYPPRAFSRNGQVTVLAPSGIKLGQRQALSEIDIEKTSTIFGIECVDRNKNYLLTTCPSVIKGNRKQETATLQQIKDYFRDRLWPYGIVNFKIRDKVEFSTEERDNINAVIRHIEKETCLEFRDLTDSGDDNDAKGNKTSNENSDGSGHDSDDEHQDNQQKPETDQQNTPTVELDPAKMVALDYIDNEIIAQKEPSILELDSFVPRNDVVTDTPNEEKTDLRRNGKLTKLRQGKVEINTTKKFEVKGTIKYSVVKAKGVTSSQPLQRSAAAKDQASKQNQGKVRVKRVRRSPDLKPAPVQKSSSGKKTSSRKNSASKKAKKPPSPSRRHANSILVLTRTPYPGCRCPTPGRVEGDYVLEINQDCFNSVNDLLHVFVHVLGLDHQHNTHDRDSFLHIVWDKLTPELSKEMHDKLPPAASLGFPYDYQSVTHYPWLQIKDGVTSIMYPIWNDGWAMGHWQGLSSTDVQKLNVLYFEQCSERKKHAKADDKYY